MNRQGRWESQRELIKRIARIATTVLPDDEGVELCFINQNVGSASNLSVEDLQRITEPLRPRGDTPIGTSLKSKILQPLVYQKLEAGSFERPLLITIITDGMPEPEPRDTLVNAIVECGQRLEEKGFPRNCKYLFAWFSKTCRANNWNRREIRDRPSWHSGCGDQVP
jgi:hypothetical protein